MKKKDTDVTIRITRKAYEELSKYRGGKSSLRETVSTIILDYMNLLHSLEREKREAFNSGFKKGFSEGYNKKTEELREKEKSKSRLTKIFGKKGDLWEPYKR